MDALDSPSADAPHDDRHSDGAALVAQARSIRDVAVRCDKLCLDVGEKLSDAVPALADLSTQFTGLSKTLGTGAIPAACDSLTEAARGMAAIGTGLVQEGNAITALIVCNEALSTRIGLVDDDIRYLLAMVSNVKVELASIADDSDGVGGFADHLQDLTARVQTALRSYKTIHRALLQRLKQVAKVQAAFAASHRSDLLSAAAAIESSLEVFSARSAAIGSATADIGAITQRISAQIGESVMTLQIGDSIRQRIEHACAGLTLSAETLAGRALPGLEPAESFTQQDGDAVVARVCQLQVAQIEQASIAFSTEVATIAALLSNITHGVTELKSRSRNLFGSDAKASDSFVGDLGQKLATAQHLIDECRQARVGVDGVADIVSATFGELQQLSGTVASMVADLTTIGTNAIVKSFRLGQRGAGFGIVAQHLRTRALTLSEGIRQLAPALQEVLSCAMDFSRVLEGQDAARLSALSAQMVEVLRSFQSGGDTLTAALARLGKEATDVGEILTLGAANLAIGDVEAALRRAAAIVAGIASRYEGAGPLRGTVEAVVDGVLSQNYTMPAERTIHDGFFKPGRSAAA